VLQLNVIRCMRASVRKLHGSTRSFAVNITSALIKFRGQRLLWFAAQWETVADVIVWSIVIGEKCRECACKWMVTKGIW
jgi:hypothetical protein